MVDVVVVVAAGGHSTEGGGRGQSQQVWYCEDRMAKRRDLEKR